MEYRERSPLYETLTPAAIYAELDRYVIGQERAKRVSALAAYNHIKRIRQVETGGHTNLKKSNVLMIGPTGVGKTHIARTLARILHLPFSIADCTEYTEAGYYGKDVEVMVAELLHATDLNVQETQKGIIFVDEIDKIARKSGGMRTGAGSRDIGGEGTQQALLKMLEGRTIFVPYNVTQHWNKHDFVEVDTTNILFICAGTFTDIRNYVDSGEIGFSEHDIKKRNRKRRITLKQLQEYGMLAELLGRLPIVVQLDNLRVGELERILVEPPDALLKEYRELLELDGVKLEMGPKAVHRIARFAHDRKVGARGLRSIMEEVFHDSLFHAPEMKGTTVRLTPKIIDKRLESFDSGMLRED